MRHGRLIAGLVLGLVVVVAVGSLAAYRVVKWAFGNTESAPQQTQGAPSNRTEPTALPVASPPVVIRGEAMAQAFRSGRLPAPLPQPGGGPEQAAAELATRVMAEDEHSTAALLTALQMSGFSVRADDGSLALESVKPGQGIVIDAWEVASLAKLFGDGMQLKLVDMSNAFASTAPPLKNAPVVDLLLEGLRASAQGNLPAMRFWADFIAELGRHSAKPYDLLAPDVDTGKVDLDVIQVSLILRRVVADLMLLDVEKNKKGQLDPAWESDRPSAHWEPAIHNFEGGARRYRRYIGNAVWHPGDGASLRLVQEGGGSSQPCTLKELEAQILDSNAYLAGKGFDKMLEYMAEHGMEGAEKYSKATSVANAVLAVIKLIAYYACMETDITMSGDPPLVRTKSTYQPGEKRTLTASVRENIGKWQALNCARLALNGANLDISLPNDGPVAGVKTQWVLVSGGVSVSHGEMTYPFVELVFPNGTPLVQDAMGPISDASAPKTDEAGHTTIDIEGVKQREKIVNPLPVMKQAEVRFTVAAKPVSMSQDLIDATGNTLGGPVGLLVGAPVEMLLRSNIYFSKALHIPVKDWESCDGGWGGTISYVSTQHWGSPNPQSGDWHITEARDETTRVEIRLRGNPNGGAGWTGTSQGTFSAFLNGKHQSVSRSGGCTCSTDETSSAVGGGTTDAVISSPASNKYEIRVGSVTGTLVDMWHSSCGGCAGHGKNAPDRSESRAYEWDLPAVLAEGDLDHPGELRGSATLPSVRPGETGAATWNLAQCQASR
jgi:hypothetical protein